jgi:phosphoribosylglycinamide formyltransferase 1
LTLVARKRVAILISGRGSNMAALIEAAADPAYPAEIALVLSNRPDAAGLARAAERGIATALIDHKRFADREEFERELHETLIAARIDIICLAGFMRVLTAWFLSRWPDRVINIHPALLPEFPGLDTHARALAKGIKTHGATVHFVVPEVDAGPIILQGSVPVYASDTEAALAARVLAVEHKIYPDALRTVALQMANNDRRSASGDWPGGPPLVPPRK